MKRSCAAGFSLLEVIVAIAILGLVVVPVCSGLLVSARINQRSESLLQAQMDVTTAVETLMAEGINTSELAPVGGGGEYTTDRFPGVTVTAAKKAADEKTFTVTVASTREESVVVTTTIRTAPSSGTNGGGTP